MRSLSTAGLLLCGILLAAVACSDDPEAPPPADTSSYKSLKAKDDVLFNLELALNQMSYGEYARLLASDFQFYFSQSDIGRGEVNVAQWPRSDELRAVENIFRGTKKEERAVAGVAVTEESTWGVIKFFYANGPPPSLQDVSDIDLRIEYVPGEEHWSEIPATDNNARYQRTVDYSVIITAGPDTYAGINIDWRIVIRKSDDGNWQIVEWYDDV